MIRNVYDTNNPEKLLLLKRQEGEAIRDVIRALNDADLKQEHIFKIAKNTLMAQIGVRKMQFVYKDGPNFLVGLNKSLPEIGPEGVKELPKRLKTLEVSHKSQNHLYTMGVEDVVPIQFRKEVGAWFLLADFAESEAERENDLIFIETIGNILAAALENRILVNELLQQETVRQELEVAGKIQKQLLSNHFNDIDGAHFAALNVPHSEVGGDFFDVVERTGYGFFVIIADVAGKGMGAALLMAHLQATIRALILSENNLQDFFHKLHDNLIKITEGEKFVTMFMAHISVENGYIEYLNAGHNPPIMLTRNAIHRLDQGTIPLGIIDLPEKLDQGILPYNPGDVLFMYTDGLVEQDNHEGCFLSEEDVVKKLELIKTHSPQKIVDEMKTYYDEHSKGVAAQDDITIMAVKFD